MRAGALLVAAWALVGASSLPAFSEDDFDLSPEQAGRIHVQKDAKAIAAIPADFKFVTPGKLTVAVAPGGPPLAAYATDAKTVVGADADYASAIAESLGLELESVPVAWIDWPLGLASGKYDAVISNVGVTEERKEKFDFSTYRQGLHGFFVKADSGVTSIKEPKDEAGLRIIVGAGTNQERILLGWNEENKKAGREPALPVYLTDDASGNLYIQSGRADVFFGPQSVSAYKAALTGKTRVVGLGPKRAYVATTTKKGNGLVYALQAALEGAITRGEYQRVLARWGEEGEAVTQSDVNPPGITY